MKEYSINSQPPPVRREEDSLKANSWILLEKRLPHLQRRILSLHTMAGAAAVAVLCVLGWWTYYMFAPVPLQTVSTLAETRTVNTALIQTENCTEPAILL